MNTNINNSKKMDFATFMFIESGECIPEMERMYQNPEELAYFEKKYAEYLKSQNE